MFVVSFANFKSRVRRIFNSQLLPVFGESKRTLFSPGKFSFTVFFHIVPASYVANATGSVEPLGN